MNYIKNCAQFISRSVFVFGAVVLVSFILYSHFLPFGKKTTFSSFESKNLIEIGPIDRVMHINKNGIETTKLLSENTYFITPDKFLFDVANFKIYFASESYQEIHIGYQNKSSWSYASRLISTGLFDQVSWTQLGINPSLYQKKTDYLSFQEFIKNPPSNKSIGYFDFDENIFKEKLIVDYSPSPTDTTISTFLRGKIVFYVYLSSEPFNMTISKQDLNWYEDPDVVSMKIYKSNEVVYSATIEDDGITDASGKSNQTQSVTIQNPGPGLPEEGTYKITIDAGGDSVINQIKTNLHKIIFDSPLYLASNSEIFPVVVPQTVANTIYTDALGISVSTPHKSALQQVRIKPAEDKTNLNANEEVNIVNSLDLKSVNLEASIAATPSASQNGLSEIFVPKSDVILKADLGYFSFSPEQFFSPSDLKLMPITKKEDMEKVDYVITNYKRTHQDGEWRVAEAEFDLSDAYVKNGKLSWIIKAPGLKERGGEVIIKDIQVELIKKPLIDPAVLPQWLRKIMGV